MHYLRMGALPSHWYSSDKQQNGSIHHHWRPRLDGLLVRPAVTTSQLFLHAPFSHLHLHLQSVVLGDCLMTTCLYGKELSEPSS